MDVIWNTGRLATEQQHIVGLECEIRQAGRAPGGEQHQPPRSPVSLERVPVRMPCHMAQRTIVERRPLHGAVVEPEAHRLDDVKFHAETGAEPDTGADILRDVWLKKGETHSKAVIRVAWGLVAV